eukprot:5586035-Ditylum_brightwellii.AAC.2
MSALSLNGFVTTVITRDGETKNQSMLLEFGNLTVDDLINIVIYPLKWRFDTMIPKELAVALWNPCYEDGKILTFIQADMPHCVKKIVNAFECSGQDWTKTYIIFVGRT